MNNKWKKIKNKLDGDEFLLESLTKKNITYKSHFILLQFEELLSELDTFYFNDVYLHNKSNKDIVEDFIREVWIQYIYLNYFIQKEMYEECRLISNTIEMIKDFTCRNFNYDDKQVVVQMLNDYCDEVITDINEKYEINFLKVDK
jgi:hypothetical protein